MESCNWLSKGHPAGQKILVNALPRLEPDGQAPPRPLDGAGRPQGSGQGPALRHRWPIRTSPAAPISSRLAPRPFVDLSDCCCFRSLPRLEEVVDQILFERQVAQLPLPLDPEILEVLPY